MHEKIIKAASFFVLFIITIVLTVMAANVNAGETPKEVIIGYQPFPTAEIVVKDKKWNEELFGVPVKWVRISSGMQAHKGLSEGKLDIALLGSSPTAAAIAKGLPVDVIWIHDIIGDNEALVVKKQSGIKTISDLKGKRIAAPFGSTTHYHLIAALRLNSINPKEVNILYLEPEEMVEAWKKNKIDGGFVWVPSLTKMLEDGGEILVTSRQLAEGGFPTGDLAVVRREFGAKYPEIVVKYIQNLDKAVKYCRDNKEDAAKAVARQLELNEKDALKQMEGVILLTAIEQDQGKYFGGTHWNFGLYNVIKSTADFLKEEGVVTELPPRLEFMKAVNGSYLMDVLN